MPIERIGSPAIEYWRPQNTSFPSGHGIPWITIQQKLASVKEMKRISDDATRVELLSLGEYEIPPDQDLWYPVIGKATLTQDEARSALASLQSMVLWGCIPLPFAIICHDPHHIVRVGFLEAAICFRCRNARLPGVHRTVAIAGSAAVFNRLLQAHGQPIP